MTTRIYIDLDGVMVDLHRGLKERFDFEFPQERTEENKNKIHLLWGEIAAYHPTFWVDLHPMPRYAELYKAILAVDPAPWILSATPEPYTDEDDYTCAIQKKAWVYYNLSDEQANRTIITKSKLKQGYINKSFDRNILIDDHPGNIQRWKDSGGIAIHHTDIDVTISELERLKNDRY